MLERIGVKMPSEMKYCKFCGEQIHMDAVICPHCCRQVEEIRTTLSSEQQSPNIIINNANSNSNVSSVDAGYGLKPKDKWISFLLCLFLGVIGAHKFYEGKIGFGILYLLTLGLFGVGVIIDLILILLKPNPYYV